MIAWYIANGTDNLHDSQVPPCVLGLIPVELDGFQKQHSQFGRMLHAPDENQEESSKLRRRLDALDDR